MTCLDLVLNRVTSSRPLVAVSSPRRRDGWLRCSLRLHDLHASPFHSGQTLPWFPGLLSLAACPCLLKLSGLLLWARSSFPVSWVIAEPLHCPFSLDFCPTYLPQISFCLHNPLFKNFKWLPAWYKSTPTCIDMMLKTLHLVASSRHCPLT